MSVIVGWNSRIAVGEMVLVDTALRVSDLLDTLVESIASGAFANGAHGAVSIGAREVVSIDASGVSTYISRCVPRPPFVPPLVAAIFDGGRMTRLPEFGLYRSP